MIWKAGLCVCMSERERETKWVRWRSLEKVKHAWVWACCLTVRVWMRREWECAHTCAHTLLSFRYALWVCRGGNVFCTIFPLVDTFRSAHGQRLFKCAIQTYNNNTMLLWEEQKRVTVSEQFKTDNHCRSIEKGLIVHDPKTFIQPSCRMSWRKPSSISLFQLCWLSLLVVACAPTTIDNKYIVWTASMKRFIVKWKSWYMLYFGTSLYFKLCIFVYMIIVL